VFCLAGFSDKTLDPLKYPGGGAVWKFGGNLSPGASKGKHLFF
jgi:hypothetical protein